MVMSLLLCSPAFALDWWVEDPQQASELELALDELWPEAPLEVRVGPVGGRGLWYDAGELVLLSEDELERAPVAQDPRAQVLLARSWARELQTLDSGWTPEPLEPLEPAPTPLSTEPAQGLRLGLTLGPGLQPSRLGPPLHLATEFVVHGQVLGLGLVATADLLERDFDEGWSAMRLGAGVQGSWSKELPTGFFEAALGLQARYLRLDHPDFLEAQWLGAASPRLRWWGRPHEAWWLGAGLALTLDGGLGRWEHPEGLLRNGVPIQPATLHVEFHLAREIALEAG